MADLREWANSPFLTFIMKLIILISLILMLFCGSASAWDNEYRNYRQEITVSHINVSGSDLINYPTFLNISKDNDMQSDYDDVIFYDGSGNLMSAELEKEYTDYALVWINITTLETSDTSFWMYYGNATCSDSWDTDGVWNTGYVMVQHLNESPANGSAGHLDSTSNNNAGTPEGFDGTAGSTTAGNGKINGANEFDGSNDYINCGTDESLNITDEILITAWIKTQANVLTTIVQKYENGGAYAGYGFFIEATTGKLRWYNDGTGWKVSTGSVCDDEWHHVVVACDAPTGTFYIDGSPSGTFTYMNPSNNSIEILYIGTTDMVGSWFDGSIDEVQISNVAHSSDWIKQDYEIVVNQSDIVTFGAEEDNTYVDITLHSYSPCCIYTNYTGMITGNYIVESNYPLNYTSLAFLMGVNHTPTSDIHSYLKVPSNSIAAEGIYRAHNRNTTPYMTWEDNTTITEDNVWQWSGGDNDSFWITKSQINDTHTWINMTGIASNVFPSMFYLGRQAIYAAPKTGIEINQHQGIIIKMFDLEGYRGRNNDYYVSMYPDTQLESTTPTENIDIWYCNDSLDPLVDDPTTCPCCVRMDTWNPGRWMDHEAWQPHTNVSYAKPLTAYAGTHPEIPPDEVVYLYFTSDTLTSKSYVLNATNHDPGICNITYAQTNTMWTYDELSDTSTAIAYTPSFYATFVRDYEEFLHHLYIANDQGVWGHSDIYNISIGVSDVSPTHCHYNYYWWDNTTDYNMNGSYIDNFWINLTYGFDPDNGAALTHVLSLYDTDYNFVAFVNDTLEGNASDIDIFVDISDYNPGEYMFKIVSTDNEGSTSVTWSKEFTLAAKNSFWQSIKIIQGFPTAIGNILSTFLSFLPLLIGILISGFILIVSVSVFSKFKRW